MLKQKKIFSFSLISLAVIFGVFLIAKLIFFASNNQTATPAPGWDGALLVTVLAASCVLLITIMCVRRNLPVLNQDWKAGLPHVEPTRALKMVVIGGVSLIVGTVSAYLDWVAYLYQTNTIVTLLWVIGIFGGLLAGPLIALLWYVKERITGYVQVTTRKSGIDGATLRNRLFGMIKLEGKINLDTAAQALGTTKDEVKNLVYELVGQGALEGKVEGLEFLITSDVASAISALEKSFAEWDEKVGKKEGKI